MYLNVQSLPTQRGRRPNIVAVFIPTLGEELPDWFTQLEVTVGQQIQVTMIPSTERNPTATSFTFFYAHSEVGRPAYAFSIPGTIMPLFLYTQKFLETILRKKILQFGLGVPEFVQGGITFKLPDQFL